jgi:branched-chain amino acid transport system permease protein
MSQLTYVYIDQILVFVIFGASLNLLIGYAGIFSAAHAAFAAVGGYVLIILITRSGLSFLVALVVGLAAAYVIGALIGVLALGLDILWLVLLTLAFQLVMVGVLTDLQVFGASFGILATGLELFGHSLNQPSQVFPLALVCSLVTFGICYRLGESPHGRILRAIRDDERAARSLGKNVFFYKLSIFAITAAMAALGGALLSTLDQLASPSLFGFNVSVQMIALVIIGGMANLFGTVLAAILIVLSTPFFQYVINLNPNQASLAQVTAYGAALVLIVIFRPQGLLPEGTSIQSFRRSMGRIPVTIGRASRRRTATRTGDGS